MNDENLNNLGSEEAASLFVSSQKKKQAEEEAARKAAEERARQEAAEAEVRRMEAEVEERKRKAEEERLRVEAAGKQLEAQKAYQAQQAAMGYQTKEKSPKSKLALSIGIGVAAVAVIAIVILVIVSGSKKGVVNYDELAIDAEYTLDKAGLDTKFYYPASIYEEVTEQESTDGKGVRLSFNSGHKKIPNMLVTIINRGLSVEDFQANMPKEANDYLYSIREEYAGANELSNEEVSSTTSGEYGYRTTYISDALYGKVHAWYEVNESGNVIMVQVDCGADPDYMENTVALENLISQKNAVDAIKTPGANPPKTYDWDGTIGNEKFHTFMEVPKDRYKNIMGRLNDFTYFGDDNGSVIYIGGEEIGAYDDISPTLSEDFVDIYFDGFSMTAQEQMVAGMDFQERSLISEQTRPNGGQTIDYMAEFKAKYNDIDYYEQDYIYFTTYEDTVYAIYIAMLAPEENKDTYVDIFTKSLTTLKTK